MWLTQRNGKKTAKKYPFFGTELVYKKAKESAVTGFELL